jgi:hypothetical protein
MSLTLLRSRVANGDVTPEDREWCVVGRVVAEQCVHVDRLRRLACRIRLQFRRASVRVMS